MYFLLKSTIYKSKDILIYILDIVDRVIIHIVQHIGSIIYIE